MALTFEYFRGGEVLGGDTLGGATMEYWRGGEVLRQFAPDAAGSSFQVAWCGSATHIVGVTNA